jgi:hypothetical protein
MDDVYRFPLLPEERVLLISNVIIGAGIIATVLVVLGGLVSGSGHTVGDAFAEFAIVRGVFAALCGVYALGLLWSLLVWRRAMGTTLRFNEDRLIFDQPGWLGGSGLHVEMAAADLRSIRVQRARLSAAFEVRIKGDAVEFGLPLSRSVDASGRRTVVRRARDGRGHAMVERLAAFGGVPAEVA